MSQARHWLTRTKARYRYPAILLREMAITDFKLRYQNSALGYLWSLLKPLAIFTILYVVFVRFLRFGGDIEFFPVYLLLGIVLWGFFSEATNQGMNALVVRGDLLRKINFPRYVVVLAGATGALVNLVFNTLVVLLFILLMRVPLRPEVLWLPVLLAELVALATALAFFLGALHVRFRDLTYIWEVFLQGAFYATPILYPLTMIPEKFARLLILSPIAQLIQDFRYALITPQTQTIDQLYGTHWARALPVSATVLLVVGSVIYFRNQARHFAEEI